jgi:predicted nucleotidyltransferase
MEPNQKNGSSFPSSVQEGLERFCHQLRAALGEKLISIILYGGVVKGEYVPQSSNVNVIVVLQEVALEVLDRAAPIILQAGRDFNLAPLLLSEDDLHRSTDVFPIKFLDIQRHHRVLWGPNVVAGLSIARDHLRWRCEQEIKNLMLRLRQFYLRRMHRSELIESTLTRALSSLLINLSVVVEIRTGEILTTKVAAIAAAEKLGINVQPLREVLALKRGELKPAAAELKRLYGAFMQTVEQAAKLVDNL